MSENAVVSTRDGSAQPLHQDDVPVGMPLAWPIVDEAGLLLLASGTILPDAEAREFLFAHCRPHRGDLAAGNTADPAEHSAGHRPVSVEDMALTIGASLGVRPQLGMGRTMHASRVIGFAPNHALFVTPPLMAGESISLVSDEQVEVVALSSQSVFRFVCTVDAVCKTPFNYVVLSEPGAIRRLRERKSTRVRTRLVGLYTTDLASADYEGLGMVCDLSALGLSFAASRTLGQVGEPLRLTFRIRTREFDIEIRTLAVIRNVHAGTRGGALAVHGLEFDALEGAQQTALKAFLFDQEHMARHGASSSR
jgi:c-di-GMP-binding flagellar brake protein YcgR